MPPKQALSRTTTASHDLKLVPLKPEADELPSQGDKCLVRGHEARVMFVGALPEAGAGLWIGVQYDVAVGASDGTVGKRRIFE